VDARLQFLAITAAGGYRQAPTESRGPRGGKTLARVFEKRQNSDYEDFAIVDPTDARDLGSTVQTFVDTCEQLRDRFLQGA
jgi:hypothetical protein